MDSLRTEPIHIHTDTGGASPLVMRFTGSPDASVLTDAPEHEFVLGYGEEEFRLIEADFEMPYLITLGPSINEFSLPFYIARDKIQETRVFWITYGIEPVVTNEYEFGLMYGHSSPDIAEYSFSFMSRILPGIPRAYNFQARYRIEQFVEVTNEFHARYRIRQSPAEGTMISHSVQAVGETVDYLAEYKTDGMSPGNYFLLVDNGNRYMRYLLPFTIGATSGQQGNSNIDLSVSNSILIRIKGIDYPSELSVSILDSSMAELPWRWGTVIPSDLDPANQSLAKPSKPFVMPGRQFKLFIRLQDPCALGSKITIDPRDTLCTVTNTFSGGTI